MLPRATAYTSNIQNSNLILIRQPPRSDKTKADRELEFWEKDWKQQTALPSRIGRRGATRTPVLLDNHQELNYESCDSESLVPCSSARQPDMFNFAVTVSISLFLDKRRKLNSKLSWVKREFALFFERVLLCNPRLALNSQSSYCSFLRDGITTMVPRHPALYFLMMNNIHLLIGTRHT